MEASETQTIVHPFVKKGTQHTALQVSSNLSSPILRCAIDMTGESISRFNPPREAENPKNSQIPEGSHPSAAAN
jgi:hypothetical protein